MKKSSPKQLIGASLGNFLSSQSRINLWASGLAQHLVLDTFSFIEFVQLCIRNYKPAILTVTTEDGQSILFHINALHIAQMLGTSGGTVVLLHEEDMSRYKKMN